MQTVAEALIHILKDNKELTTVIITELDRIYHHGQFGDIATISTQEMFASFYPACFSTLEEKGKMARAGSEKFFSQISRLLTTTQTEPPHFTSATHFANAFGSHEYAEKLKLAFDANGSNKANYHDYHLVYAGVFNEIRNPGVIVEIGLGSGNPNILSNMGPEARPGASLRAFSSLFPGAEIIGADIDKEILFNDQSITTYYLDQLNEDSFSHLRNALSNRMIDVFIDDGLHCLEANLNSVVFAANLVRPGGWILIEDITVDALPAWKLIGAAIATNFTSMTIECRGGCIFLAQRRGTSPP